MGPTNRTHCIRVAQTLRVVEARTSPLILTIISFKHKAYNGGIPWPITFERIEIFAGCIEIWKEGCLVHKSMCDRFGKSQAYSSKISKEIVLLKYSTFALFPAHNKVSFSCI